MYHVFCFDTECLFSFSKTSDIINFLFPLISMSSIMVYNAKDAAVTTPSNLLKTLQFFSSDTKLIIRIAEFPFTSSMNETNYTNFIRNSSLYNKLQSDNVSFKMIPDFALSPETMNLKKMMRISLFEEIITNCHCKKWTMVKNYQTAFYN